MSSKFPGGFITKNYVAPTPAAAPGIWTLDQQLQAQKTGTWPNVQYNYIEDVFSTYLYTGNSSTQTITNGIDLSTKGGLVWVKWRSGLVGSGGHVLVDTARGANKYISSNTTTGESTQDTVSAFNTTGFNLTGDGGGKTNYSGDLYASWTFREQPKFFDVVTYTGNGAADQIIPHSLASIPGGILIKRLDTPSNWPFWRRNDAGDYRDGWLNRTDPSYNTVSTASLGLTTTTFNAGKITQYDGYGENFNALGGTYVAYLFAHNAGGFGLTGTENVISCGSFTGSAFNNIGFEPQWLLIKNASNAGDWRLYDTMRGLNATNEVALLRPNLSNPEAATSGAAIDATGFKYSGGADTHIYIAIRRGPMKVPTDGTKVFAPVAYSTSSTSVVNSGFPTDMAIAYYRTASGNSGATSDRLRGSNATLFTPSTGAEVAIAGWSNYNTSMSGVEVTAGSSWANGSSFIWWNFRRAPGFFDEVCYTGDDADGRAVTHNLTSTPELMIVKSRSASAAPSWWVWNASTSGGLILNSADASSIYNWSPTDTPTSTTFKVSRGYGTNYISQTYVAYLFATCPGVSKVGSYTGTGATQTIACGFAAGARFVLIKRTDSTGDWYVWDTARGMVAGTDPKLALNTTAAESNANWVYTATTGFQIVTTDASVNASGGTYIFLAIA